MKNIKLGLGGLVAVIVVFAALNNAFAQAAPEEVDARLNLQAQRVSNGLANGSMTQAQANRVSARDANINARLTRDEAAHNGHLTAGETRRLNRSENHVSGHIYADKHDGS